MYVCLIYCLKISEKIDIQTDKVKMYPTSINTDFNQHMLSYMPGRTLFHPANGHFLTMDSCDMF